MFAKSLSVKYWQLELSAHYSTYVFITKVADTLQLKEGRHKGEIFSQNVKVFDLVFLEAFFDHRPVKTFDYRCIESVLGN